MTRYLKVFGLLVFAATISSCAAAFIALSEKDITVQTLVSDTIFLDPVSPAQKTVWIEIKNTSDKDLDLSHLRTMIANRGYQVVDDPNAATYRVQVQVLTVAKTSVPALAKARGLGHGGVAAGAGTGALVGGAVGGLRGLGFGTLGGALLGGIGEVFLGALVKSVTYGVVTDVQISVKSDKPISESETSILKQGTSTSRSQQSARKTKWKIYRTRITSAASKANLKFDEARPHLQNGLLRSISGML